MPRAGATPTDQRAIALLRAVNVGGRGVLPMAGLKQVLSECGFIEPQTVLQSGNVVFGLERRRGADRPAAIEARIETALRSRMSIDTTVFVRTATEWNGVVTSNPFAAEAAADPSHTLVMVMRDVPSSAAVAALRRSIAGRERVEANGRELYIVYPDGIGRSKLTGTSIERALGTSGTARNWNTVLKLAALARV